MPEVGTPVPLSLARALAPVGGPPGDGGTGVSTEPFQDTRPSAPERPHGTGRGQVVDLFV